MTGDVLPETGRLAERKVGIWIGAEGGAPGMNGKPEPAAERSEAEWSCGFRLGGVNGGSADRRGNPDPNLERKPNEQNPAKHHPSLDGAEPNDQNPG